MAKKSKPIPKRNTSPIWLGLVLVGLIAIGGFMWSQPSGFSETENTILSTESPQPAQGLATQTSLPTANTITSLAPTALTQAVTFSPISPISTPNATAAPLQQPIHYTYKVINTYPHDATAFTQGLIYQDNILYEGTGLKGETSLRKVALETGEVLQMVNIDSHYFGEGITIFEDNLIQLTWQAQLGFVYNKDTFEQKQTFTYPTEGWGITHNGQHLIMSDGTANLYFLDPISFQEVRRIEVHDGDNPILPLNELEYVNDQVYANVWKTDMIAMINPVDGQVTGWLDLSGILGMEERQQRVDVLNGIAYDQGKNRLFVTGKWWPKLFEIELQSVR